MSPLPLFGMDAATASPVIVTHAHFDHLGNVSSLPQAEIIIARREFEFWLSPYAQRSQFGAYTERQEISSLEAAASQDRIIYVDGQYSPAPGIEVVEVGGHTPRPDDHLGGHR